MLFKRTLLFSVLLICLSFQYSFAQNPIPPTSAAERIATYETRKALGKNSIANQINFRNVGPTVFSGRVVDLDVHPTDPSIFYVAYASGGLWKTENNGTTFKPIFDNEIVMTIGDIAVDWENEIIWVGTGENNSSRSSFSGLGMFKSTDDGKTWERKGLEESHHIGRVILHPTNPDILWVAVLGHLYSPNKERGIYKTIDGGNTWTQTLYVNENAGAVDLSIDPQNPDMLFASTWERERRAWDFKEAGSGSGIYKSANGGTDWEKISTEANGFPDGQGTGRIGLALTKQDSKNILYAIVDNYNRRPKKDLKKEGDGLVKADFRNMSKENFLKLEDKKLTKFLKSNGFPKKYSAKSVKAMIKSDKITSKALVEYLEDSNSLLFDTEVVGAEVYRSEDNGQSWKKTHEGYLDHVYYSYGYYFGQIRASAIDPDKIFIYGVPILISKDAGKTWKSINRENVHVDHHALYVNPNRDKHIILGNDGGVNISYDDGENWVKCNSPAVGQFYSVNVDNAEPYNIYGGLQDNGVWTGPSTYKESVRWHNSGHYPYKEIMGGDGMQVQIDSRNRDLVYTGYQYGNYFRVNQRTGKRTKITPKHDLGERPLRWNWQSPIHLSIHNEDIVYFGSNKLHRSFNKGENFSDISGDLTKGGQKGDVAFGTLTSIHESPLQFGLIYVGTDDGYVHVTQDGGNNWTNITAGLPSDLWVTKVYASQYEKGRVYASLNGFRWDDHNSYIYASENFGKTWTKLGTDLPKEVINVIKEDPKNENLIYVGSDHGLYVSLDRGQSFMLLNNGLPAVSIHDVVVQEREGDLVLGTHGRSFYVGSVKELQQMTEGVLSKKLYAFDLGKVKYNSRWGNAWNKWRKPQITKIKIPFYTNSTGNMAISIKTEKGLLLKNLQHASSKGLNYVEYDLSFMGSNAKDYEKYLNSIQKEGDEIVLKKSDDDKWYLKPGKYEVELFKDGVTIVKELVVK